MPKVCASGSIICYILGAMRTDFDHLSPQKQSDLQRVVQLIFEEFDAAFGPERNGWTKAGRILKIILYGSHTRDKGPNELQTSKGHLSDFDLLIIVNDEQLTDRAKYWANLEDRLTEAYRVTKTLRTPVNFMVHTLQEVTDGLAQNRSFVFQEVVEEGIALYQSDHAELHSTRQMTPTQTLALAEEFYDEWFSMAKRKLRLAQHAISREFNKQAAFLLHQTCESLYRCVLLVWTFDTPPVHDLALLRRRAERRDLRLACVWPHELMKDRARFEKLEEAFVKAQDCEHYHIISEELDWIFAHVQELCRVVQEVCAARIDRLRIDAQAHPDKI